MIPPPVLATHWTQEQAATAMGRSRRTIRSWCLPTRWRPVLLAADPLASEVAGRPMYRIADVVAAERASVTGRHKTRRRGA